MPVELRAQREYPVSRDGNAMQTDSGPQYSPRSRPVSFYDNFKDVPASSCVTSTMSVGDLSQSRDDDAPASPQSGNNNNNNNNRVNSAVSAGNVSKIHGVKVMGAVSTGNIGKTIRGDKELNKAPSMANCLSTTVPVNLAASQIAGRHTPTRNSLRHSRMIVMNRTGARYRKSMPPLIQHWRSARCLAALQTILGIAVTSLSLWLLLWTPNLPFYDNPYWSGMPLLLSGSFGICLLCCFKKEYPGMNPGFCLTSTKILSAFLAVTATVACAIACVAAGMHLARLAGQECSPQRVLNATCVCKPRGASEEPERPEDTVGYVDLNCPEVEGILTILLIFSVTCNAIGAIVAGWYTYLHWSTRDRRPYYVQVRTQSSASAAFNSRPIYNPTSNGR